MANRDTSTYPVELWALRLSIEHLDRCEGLCLDEIESPVTYLESVDLVLHEAKRLTTPRTLDDYHEDHGFVLWWKFPIEEPPYSGSPLCDDWPGYHTHWTPLPMPEAPTPVTALSGTEG